MDCVITWLNINSGALIVLATFSLVCITSWYAFITSRMVRIIEKQTAINIEPIILIPEERTIKTVDGKIKLEIINDGTVNVTNVSFFPRRAARFLFPKAGEDTTPWTVTLPLKPHKFEAPVLTPGQRLPIELDVAELDKLTDKDGRAHFADFAFELNYRREADRKQYEIHRYYKRTDDTFNLIRML